MEQPHLDDGFAEKVNFSKPRNVLREAHTSRRGVQFLMSDLASKPSGCFEERSCGHGARFQVTPECNQQLASQGHNPDLAQTGVALAKPPLIPLTKLAFGLVPQPAPGNFNGHGSDKSVSGLFDPLIFASISALIGCIGQARTGADFPAVAKVSPAEELHHEEPGAVDTNAFEAHQLADLLHAGLL